MLSPGCLSIPPLRTTLGYVLVPWAAHGPLWGTMVCHVGRLGLPQAIRLILNRKWIPNAELTALKSAACVEKEISQGYSDYPPGSPGSDGSGTRATAALNPTSLAPGAKMMRV